MKFGSEVAFVDAGIADGARLVEGLDENVESHVISADGPALEQMAAAVAHRKGLTAIHVFAHGRAGTLAFAAGDVDASIFDGSRDALQQLSQALAPDAAINLWSCDVASGTAGSTFVSGLSIWLGRPVHAAAGKIGAAGLGGSWMLAGSDGAVMPPLTAEAVAGYAGVLASNAATTATDLITQTANADTLIVTSTGQIQAADLFDGAGGLDTILVSGAAGVTVDLSGAGTTQATGFRNHEILSFNNTSGTTTVTLNAAQFGTGLIASALSVVGSAGLQRININNATVFSATAWTFTSWTSGADAISITGTAGADTLTGSSQADLLSGLSGNDMLDGGAGADTMAGGLGDDTYVVDNAGDVVTENAGEGTDTVLSSVTRTLAANIEKLTLTGTAAISGTGNTLANVITGNTAANLIDGGSGADTMIGGKGDDTYVVDNAGDIITEKASEGVDRVQSSVTYTLAANVEHLTLTGTAAINGIGNELANIITGNAANNTLTGKAGNDTLNGGAGADKMVGGLGNDTYVVDNAGDTAVEVDGEGIDIVQSSVGFVLGTGVDNLTLTGTAMINGTGNTLNNVIIGNSAANVLYGYAGNDTLNGGAGADQMFGGLGNDI